ncbi:MAG: thioredoxin [Gammaproteobacteria bacterium]|jgi:thioredoxin 1
MPNTNLTVTDKTFNEEVLKSDVPVLIDFWAEWCGPCLAYAPLIEDAAKNYDGRIKVRKLNVDENPASAKLYNIRSIPTLAIFKDGEVQDISVGVQPKAKLEKLIERYVQ